MSESCTALFPSPWARRGVEIDFSLCWSDGVTWISLITNCSSIVSKSLSMTPLKFGECGATRLFFPVIGSWLILFPFLRAPSDLAWTRMLDRGFLSTIIGPEPLEIANYVECDERRVYNDK